MSWTIYKGFRLVVSLHLLDYTAVTASDLWKKNFQSLFLSNRASYRFEKQFVLLARRSSDGTNKKQTHRTPVLLYRRDDYCNNINLNEHITNQCWLLAMKTIISFDTFSQATWYMYHCFGVIGALNHSHILQLWHGAVPVHSNVILVRKNVSVLQKSDKYVKMRQEQSRGWEQSRACVLLRAKPLRWRICSRGTNTLVNLFWRNISAEEQIHCHTRVDH